MSQHLMIDTPETLAGLVDELADENFLAVDTEFIRERTFFPAVVSGPSRK